MHAAHGDEVVEDLGAAVDLEVFVRAVAFVAAHHRREGAEFGPAHQQLGRAHIAEQAGVAADVAVVIGVADQPGRQRGADHRSDAVVAGEVDRLVARPQQGAVPPDVGEPCAHEEHNVAGAPARCHRARVDLRPDRRPSVVHHHAVDAVGKHHVGREIFAEIGHPARQAIVDHPVADHRVGEPVGGGGVGEVDHAAVEFAEVDQVDATRRIARQIAAFGGDAEQFAVVGEVRVHIAEEADAALPQVGDPVMQAGVARLVRLPVPEQPPAEAGGAQAHPVLAPQAGDGRAGGDDRISALEAALPVLQAEDRAFVRPAGQARLAAEARRQPRHQRGEARRGEQFDAGGHLPRLHLVIAYVAKVERGIGGGVDVAGVAARGDEGRLRIVGVPVIAAGMGGVGLEGQQRGLVAADAGFGRPQREAAAAQVEIRHLLARAPDMFVGFGDRAQPEAVGAGVAKRLQVQRAVRRRHAQLRRGAGLGREQQRIAVGGRMPQRHARIQPVGQVEVAAKHEHVGGAVAEEERRRVGRVRDHGRVADADRHRLAGDVPAHRVHAARVVRNSAT